jgi:uncharacterized protein YdiU (UPF0061 family)
MHKMITESLSANTFINEFTATFEGDKSGNPNPRQTPGMLYSRIMPTPVKKPELLAWSEELAASAGIKAPENDDISILGGNLVSASMFPYAACYAGHQFGHWAGQLGDGRAITLGEWQTPSGATLELQLKGAGPTPYSRRGDGRAVLRSSVREYLMSEAMFYLGVPTTRALSLVTTGDQVLRDMFYDGRPALEPGAIVMRVSPSFLRFGNFEMLAARQETENLRKLTDWTIERFYPHLTGENKIISWFAEVVSKTASLMADWARVGFVHGVMNTDNMSILGLTIDYGPFSFLDAYDPDFTPNTTDLPGRRYAFGKQPGVAYWNLGCLASAIAPLLENTEELVAVLESYSDIYRDKYYQMMAGKLGFDELREGDHELTGLFEELLAELRPDMTIFYQLLIDLPDLGNEKETITHFTPCFYDIPNSSEARALYELIQRYRERMKGNAKPAADTAAVMRANNPRFVLRNYLLHQAIEELEKGNDQLFIQLKAAIRQPYSTAHDQFFKLRPEWAGDQPGSSTLSCSS